MNPIPLTRPTGPGGPAPAREPLRRFGGKYLLVRKLAEGGMAELFLAKQVGAEGFERDVVIKCMLGHLSRHPDFVQMFLDEARLAARLFHPNIVQISDLGVADDRYYICMEYLPGEDLEEVIAAGARKGQPMSPLVAARVILSAAEGLEFAHAHQEGGRRVNLVHRDVSPSNILVTYQGTVKVVDFGIAKASSRLVQTQPGTLKGKLGYMSPEQARGEPLDARSDVFSLGVTFYELLTGQRVFQRDTELGVLLALMEQPIPRPSEVRPDVPQDLDAIVMRALERRPEARYQSAAELHADLESYLAKNASLSGGAPVARYMQWLFGPERVRARTQLPTLAEMGGAGEAGDAASVGDFGTEPTLVRAPTPAEGEGRERTATSRGPVEVAAPSPTPVLPRRSGGLKSAALGALGALVVLGAAGAALVSSRPELVGLGAPAASSPAPVVEAQAAPVEPAPAVAAPAVAEPVRESAPPAEEVATPETAVAAAGSGATPAAGAEEEGAAAAASPGTEVEPVAAVAPEAPARTPTAASSRRAEGVVLDGALVNRRLRTQGAALQACGEKHRDELPPDGVVRMQFTVRNSGRVDAVQTTTQAVEGSPLAGCLAARLKAVRFPANRNAPELTYEAPLRFQ
jgi:serine/threonine-protein kinase